MKSFQNKRNKKIITFLKGLKYIINNGLVSGEKEEILKKLEEELEKSVKKAMNYSIKKIKELGGLPKLKALEKQKFYSKGDNLNLYSYLFFSRFKNIDTVKFPTRGRDYGEKIKFIEDTLKKGKVDSKQLDLSISIERTHYDLTYLFSDKLWFRNMIKDI